METYQSKNNKLTIDSMPSNFIILVFKNHFLSKSFHDDDA